MIFALLPLLAAVTIEARHLQNGVNHHHKRGALAISISGSPSQCGQTSVTITGGTAPFQVTIQSPSGGNPLMYLPPTSQEGLFHWTVDVASGTAFVLQVDDVAAGSAKTQSLTVGSSSDNTCLPGGSSAIGGMDDVFVWVSSVEAPSGGGGAQTSPDGANHDSVTAKGGAGGAGANATPTGDKTGATPTADSTSTTPSTTQGMSTRYVTETAAPQDDNSGTGGASTMGVSAVLAALAGVLAGTALL